MKFINLIEKHVTNILFLNMKMHQIRKDSEIKINHTRNYLWRLIKQSFSNFLQTVKGQQILQVIVCLIVSLGFNIYFGVIGLDQTSNNMRSVMYICFTLLALVVALSIITAPFHLDHELQEKLFQQKEKIIGLETQIENLQKKEFIAQQTTNKYLLKQKQNIPKDKNKPIIKCSKLYSINAFVSRNFEITVGREGKDKLLLADFTYEHLENSYEKFDVRSEIKVDTSTDGEPTHTIKGIWFNKEEEYQSFIANDTWSVIIGFVVEKQFFIYEHNLYDPVGLGHTEMLAPNIFKVDGKVFDIFVRLIGYHYSKIVLNNTYKFKLLFEPSIIFKEI